MKKDRRQGNIAVFILLLIAFVGMLFLVQSDSLKKFGIEKLDFSYKKSTSTVSTGGGGKGSSGSGSSTGGQVKSSSTINPKSIPEGFTLEQLSPHFKKIRIGSVLPGSVKSYGRIYLIANLKENEVVNVTGWMVKGKNGNQLIPKAVEVYEPFGITPPSDIFLKKGHVLNIYSSRSVIGQNLRLNRCTGYLESLFDFVPSLPINCPRIYGDRSELYDFSSQCENYIRSLRTCRLPEVNFSWLVNDSKCRDFLSEVNYRGCFDKHRQDADFLSREWRVWTGSRFLSERHDKVLLLDEKGLLVDLREY